MDLSLYQKNVLGNQIINMESSLYTIGGYYVFHAIIDTDNFYKAVTKTVNEIEALRVKIIKDKNEYKQIIDDNHIINYEFIDYTSANIETSELKSRLKDDFLVPFDIFNSLYQFKLIKMKDDEYYFYVKYHHIIADAYVVGMIFKRLKEILEGLNNNEIIEDKDWNYINYINNSKEYSNSTNYKDSLNFFKQTFSQIESNGNEFGDRTRKSKNHKICVPKDKYKELELFCRSNSIGIQHFILGIVEVYFSKLLNKKDLIIGMPLLNRSNKEELNTAALYANIMPLLLSVDKDKKFIDACKDIRKEIKKYNKHKKVSIGEIIKNCNLDINIPFEILLSYEKINFDLKYENTDVDAITFTDQAESRALSIYIREFSNNSDVYIDFDYNLDVSKNNINFETFFNFFNKVIDNYNYFREKEIKDICVLSDEETKTILSYAKPKANNNGFRFVLDEFDKQVRINGKEIAIVTENEEITYEELNNKVNVIIDRLIQRNVNKGDFVGISMNRSIEMIASIFAVLKLGAAYVAIDYKYPIDRINIILDESNAKVLLSKSSYKFNGINDIEIINPELLDYSKTANEYISDIDEEMIAYALFTSGSTGKPKGVLVKHLGLTNIINHMRDTYPCTSNDTYLFKTSFTFDVSISEIFGFYQDGGSLLILNDGEEKNPEAYLNILNKVTHVNFVPSMLNALIDNFLSYNMSINSSIKYLFIAGEELKVELINKIPKVFKDVKIVNLYGPTEATVYASEYVVDLEKQHDFIPIGTPITNDSLYILNDNGELMPIGFMGELCIGGKGVCKGYINRDDLNETLFIRNKYSDNEILYRTGDYAVLLEDGNFKYKGRIDSQVKIRGFRIEIGEVERAIMKHNDIDDCRVIDISDKYGKYLCAYVTSHNPIDINDLKKFLIDKLPNYMMPQYFIAIDEMPLNSSGKLDRKSLPMPDVTKEISSLNNKDMIYEEKVLADCFTKVLQVSNINKNGNFFEYGGDSIKAIELLGMLRKAGYSLQINDIFNYPVINDMALKLKKIDNVDRKITEHCNFELSPIQQEFFDNSFVNENHWNQSILLKYKGKLNLDYLQDIYDKLIANYESLRLVFKKNEDKIYQQYESCDNIRYTVKKYEVNDIKQSNDLKYCYELNNSFILEKGPLFKFIVLSTSEYDYVFLCAHHLIIDFVSWKIVLSDFIDMYNSLESNKDYYFIHSGVDFSKWINYLESKAKSEEVLGEIDYWKNLKIYNNLIDDNEFKGTQRDAVKEKIKLDNILTNDLINKCNSNINVLLLTALSESLNKWKQIKEISIEMEGHGRETNGDNIDIYNTIGWVTSRYPASITCINTNIKEKLNNTKSSIIDIPNKGINYGIINRYVEKIKNNKCDIVFNYLGDINLISDDKFNIEEIMYGKPFNEDSAREYIFGIDVYILNSELNFEIEYNKNRFSNNDIDQLLSYVKESMIEIIDFELNNKDKSLDHDLMKKFNINNNDISIINERYSNISEILPLNSMQRGILFHYVTTDSSTLYLEQIDLECNFIFDEKDVRNAFDMLEEKYKLLKSIIVYDDVSLPVQVIKEDNKTEININNISDNDIKIIDNFKNKDKNNKFILDKGPLFRMNIFNMDNKSRIVCSFHHIIGDGWTFTQIINDFIKTYKSLQENKLVNISDKVSYKKYFNNINKIDINEIKDYWNSYLRNYDSCIEIPKFYYDDVESKSEQEDVFTLDLDTYNNLLKYSKNNGFTLNALLQTAWGILLQKYNDTEDVIFGTVVSTRNIFESNIDNAIGLFINTIPLRVKVTENESINDLIRKVQDGIINGNSNSYLSLAEISNDLVFNNITVFENYPIEDGLYSHVKLVDIYEETNYPITVAFTKQETISVRILYKLTNYCARDIELIFSDFIKVINSIISTNTKLVNEITLVDDNMKNTLLYEFNCDRNITLSKDSVYKLFVNQVEIDGNKAAIKHNDNSVTYNELNKLICYYSALLKEKNISSQSVVAVEMNTSINRIAVLFAILKRGACYLPLLKTWPLQKKKSMMDITKAEVIVSDNDNNNYGIESIVINKDYAADEIQNLDISYDNNVNNPAYIIFTSGSTGKPKGISVSQDSLIKTVINQNYIDIEKEDRILNLSNYAFDGSIFDIYASLLNGSTLVLIDEEDILDIDKLGKTIKDKEISKFFVTTALFNVLVDNCYEYLQDVKAILFGGEKVSLEHVKMAKKLLKNTKLIHMYGPTECTVYSTFYNIEDINNNYMTIPIGRPLKGSSAYILDKNKNMQRIGVVGELYISEDRLSNGYINNPTSNKKSFVEDILDKNKIMYKTGDLCRFLPDGNIEFVDRVDTQVKIRGFRIELGEIEASLLRLSNINNAFVTTIGDENSRELIAFVTVKKELSNLEIKEKLKETLPDYMVPNKYFFIDEIPLNQNGKVNKKKLLNLIENEESLLEEEIVSDKTEAKVLELFKAVLENSKVRLNDDFFAVGGHSLKAMILANKLTKEFNKKIEISTIFQLKTPKDIAQFIKSANDVGNSLIKHFEEKELYKASSVQNRIYLLEDISENSLLYNIPALFKIEGNIDVSKLEAVIKEVINRHEALRTSFISIDGVLYQKINTVFEFKLNNDMGDDLQSLITDNIHKFNLSKAPLVKGSIIDCNNEKYLLIDIHHIISDGVSMSIIIDEVNKLYNGAKLEEVEYQYKDYSEWEIINFNKESCKKQREYWNNKLADLPEPISLNYDYDRPQYQSFEGDILNKEIDEALSKEILDYCSKNNMTLYMFLLAVFNVVIYKYSGSKDLIIGTPVANRNNNEFLDTVGMFVNTIPLRSKINPLEKFNDYLLKVKGETIESIENSEYPLEFMVDELNINRDPSRNLLFDISFGVQNSGEKIFKLKDVNLVQQDLNMNLSKVDLTLQGREENEKILLDLEYCTNLFKQETADKFLRTYINVISKVLKDDTELIKDIEIILDDDIKVIERNTCSSNNILSDINTLQKYIKHVFTENKGNIAINNIVTNTKSKLIEFNMVNKSDAVLFIGKSIAMKFASEYNYLSNKSVYIDSSCYDKIVEYVNNNEISRVVIELNDYKELGIISAIKDLVNDITINAFSSKNNIFKDELIESDMVDSYYISYDYKEIYEELFNNKITNNSMDNLRDIVYCSQKNIAMNYILDNNEEIIREVSNISKLFDVIELSYEDFNIDIIKDILSALSNNSKAIISLENICDSKLINSIDAKFNNISWKLKCLSLSQEHINKLQEARDEKALSIEDINEIINIVNKNNKNKVILNVVLGLELMDYEDTNESYKYVDAIQSVYGNLVTFESSLFSAKPWDLDEVKYEKYNMILCATTFEEFMYYASVAYEDELIVPEIVYEDSKLNDEIKELNKYICDKKQDIDIYNEKITYENLDLMSDNVYCSLKNKGITSGDRVSILLSNPLDALISLVGIIKSGAAYVPINTEYPKERVNYILKDSDSKIVITKDKFDFVNESDTDVIYYDDISKDDNNKIKFTYNTTPDDIAYIIYTSGSTGTPKGVKIKNSSIVNFAKWRISKYEFTNKDITLQTLSNAFDGYGSNLYSALLSGSSLVLLGESIFRDYKITASLIDSLKITNFSTVPAIYKAILINKDVYTFNSLRFVVLAGEKTSKQLIKLSKDKVPNAELINEYGPTECCITTTYLRNMNENNSDIIGVPVDNVKVYVLNEDLNSQPIGLEGELCVSGISLSSGYVNMEEETSKRFIKSPFDDNKYLYKTGDLVCFTEDGELRYLERIDGQVKILGNRIELDEIENVTREIDGITECIAVIIDHDSNKKIYLYYVSNDENISANAIKDYIFDKLPFYMLPAKYVKIDNIPLTYNGKVDKKLLIRNLSDYKAEEVSEKLELNELNTMLLQNFKEVLCNDDITVNDNFFDVGGDSIKAMQLISKVSEEGYSLKIKDIFKYPSVIELSKSLEMLKEFSNEKLTGKLELNPIQKWFFNKNYKDMDHWNQSVLLYSKDKINLDILKDTFNNIIEYHDGLRTEFKSENGNIIQKITDKKADSYYKINEIDIYDENISNTIKSECEKAHKSINIANKELIKLVLFRTYKGDYLFIVMHHLIIDTVSWRIIIDDLQNNYFNKIKGLETKYIAKTSSLIQYSEAINEYINKNSYETSYWNKIEDKAKELESIKLTKCSFAECGNEEIEVSKEDTKYLLNNLNSKLNADINTLLLVSYASSIKEIFNINNIGINLESHGREGLGSNIELSRTVGWFTSQYPVLIDLSQDNEEVELLKDTSDKLAGIPNKGIGYSIFKNRGMLGKEDNILFSFNYLGQYQNTYINNDNSFEISNIDTGDNISPNCEMNYLFMINASINEDKLIIIEQYNKAVINEDMLKKFNDKFLETVDNVINNMDNKQNNDFLDEIDKEDLDFILRGFN